MSLYLDASVLVPLHVQEPKSTMVEHWIAHADAPLVISDLAASEFCSAISRYVRMDEFPLETAAQIIETFHRWRDLVADPVENLPTDIRLAGRLVREPHPRLLVPDAIHLATCQRLGLTLVSHDDDLLTIARRMGLSHVAPE